MRPMLNKLHKLCARCLPHCTSYMFIDPASHGYTISQTHSLVVPLSRRRIVWYTLFHRLVMPVRPAYPCPVYYTPSHMLYPHPIYFIPVSFMRYTPLPSNIALSRLSWSRPVYHLPFPCLIIPRSTVVLYPAPSSYTLVSPFHRPPSMIRTSQSAIRHPPSTIHLPPSTIRSPPFHRPIVSCSHRPTIANDSAVPSIHNQVIERQPLDPRSTQYLNPSVSLTSTIQSQCALAIA